MRRTREAVEAPLQIIGIESGEIVAEVEIYVKEREDKKNVTEPWGRFEHEDEVYEGRLDTVKTEEHGRQHAIVVPDTITGVLLGSSRQQVEHHIVEAYRKRALATGKYQDVWQHFVPERDHMHFCAVTAEGEVKKWVEREY